MAKMKDRTFRISSLPAGLINKRYLVKASLMELPSSLPSIMVTAYDVLSDEFVIRFYNNEDEAINLINLFKAAY